MRFFPALSTAEYMNLTRHLAPVESDGPFDPFEWNLFEVYLSEECVDPANRYGLSEMLERYMEDTVRGSFFPILRVVGDARRVLDPAVVMVMVGKFERFNSRVDIALRN